MDSSTNAYPAEGFPIEFHAVLDKLTAEKKWKLKRISPLLGGASGAFLYQVAIYDLQTENFFGQYVLKLSRLRISAPKEAKAHEQARNKLSSVFRDKHTLPLEAAFYDDASNTSALIYPIAGNSLSEVKPFGTLRSAGNISAALTQISKDLLLEWGPSLTSVQPLDPSAILKEWLYGLDLANLLDFLKNQCNFDAQKNGLIFNGEVFPNPLYYALNKEVWPEIRNISVPQAFCHGDLNTNNVLLRFDPQIGEVEDYYYIDFAYFREKTPLFYDLLYLELSYLLDHVRRLSGVPIDDVAQTFILLSLKFPNKSAMDSDFEGWCSIINSLRQTFDKWAKDTSDGLYDDLWGIYHLAGVAVGIQFTSMPELSNELRYLCFMWAAGHLRSFWKKHNIKQDLIGSSYTLQPIEEISYWEAFLQACHRFDTPRQYIGIFGPEIRKDSSVLNSVGRVPWSLILDFDPNTDKGGLYSQIKEELDPKRRIQRVLPNGDAFSPTADSVCYWLHTQNLDEPDIVSKNGPEWRKKFGLEVKNVLDRFAKSSYHPTTIIVFWENVSIVETLLYYLEISFENNTNRFDVVLITKKHSPRIDEITDKFSNSKSIVISLETITQGLRNLLQEAPQVEEKHFLPKGTLSQIVEIPAERIHWLKEDLDIVDLASGQLVSGNDGQDAFYRGATISWLDLKLGRGITREKSKKLIDNLTKDLAARQTTRHNLFHAPGAGGTTMARQVAWELHTTYPTVLLFRISNIKETIARMQYIYTLTQNSVLAVVESSDIDEILLESLYRELSISRIPVTFLYVARRLDFSTGETDRRIYLSEVLVDGDLDKFIERYSLLKPSRKSFLVKLKKSEKRFHNPFLIGLTAYERDFDRIQSYVSQRMEGISPTANKIVKILAAAHFYTGRAIDINLFRAIINKQPDFKLILTDILNDYQLNLFIKEENGWRPTHYLISEQILKNRPLSLGENKEIWKQTLPDLAHDIIDALNEVGSPSSEPILELLQSLFIDRSWASLVPVVDESGAYRRPRFSNLIMDIPTEKERRDVFEHLCEHFPNEGHFLAHLGRLLYSSRDPDYLKAIESCATAVSKDEKDPLLHHMLGMARKAFAEAQMQDIYNAIALNSPIKNLVEDLHITVNTAIACFDRCIQINPSSEHALTTGIQLLAKTARFGRDILAPNLPYVDFFLLSEAEPYIEYRNKAEEYLSNLRELYSGRVPSGFLNTSNGLLKPLYGNHQGAIADLKRLLQKQDVYRPRIRTSIVYTYLDEVNRDWNMLDGGSLYDILNLMADNLSQESDNDLNIRLWFNAARRLPLIGISEALGNLLNWFSRGEALDAAYYLYILHVLLVIDGGQKEARQFADFYIERCTEIVRRYRRPRTDFALDMLGDSTGMARLINHGEITWEANLPKAIEPRRLLRVFGRVSEFHSLNQGYLNYKGLRVFFIPRLASPNEDDFSTRNIGDEISFLLGFTHEGLRAYDPKRVK